MTSPLAPPAAASAAFPGDGPGLQFEQRGASVVVSLDRPAKLNAINSAMKAALASRIPAIARNPQVYAVILRATPGRMFSAGGDIREFYDLALADPARANAECAREYGLIWLLDCFSKPTVALIDGAVMGTGVGIVQCATHRVAGPGYRFQMPETAIGFFPDNGVCWTLARLPGEIGTYLGLLGAPLDRPQAFRLGLVTHCIDAAHFDEIAGALADAEPIDPLLARFHAEPAPSPAPLPEGIIARCFSAATVTGIVARLEAETESRPWCQATLADLRSRSPLALEATLQHLRRCRHLDLRQTLTVDYRLATRLVAANDFIEGVCARLIQRSATPRWRPASLHDLDPSAVERLFEPLNEGEMVLPTRQEMQASRV